MSVVRDNAPRNRFELGEGEDVVFALYQRQGSNLVIRHVEAPPHRRGTGAAGELMRGIAEIARAEGRTIVPLCGYASAWMRRHREYRDLLG